MGKQRQLNRIAVGEYIATIFWEAGSGIEERTRFAESTGVKVTDKWVYIYLRDGEEIVKLSRSRNSSSQIYIDMTLRDAIEERVTNGVINSAGCCWGIFGMKRSAGGEDSLYEEREPCQFHTPEWLEQEVDSRIANLITDEKWPSVLAARTIAASEAAGRLAEAEKKRDVAREAGEGEWRKVNGSWCIAAHGHRVGDVVLVRTKTGKVSHHILGNQVSASVYLAGDEVAESQIGKNLSNIIQFPRSA